MASIKAWAQRDRLPAAPPLQGSKKGEAKEKTIANLADKHMGIETLKTQNSDRLDFHDAYVGAVSDALHQAFRAGFGSSTGAMPPGSVMKGATASVEKIAKEKLGLDSLKVQKSDGADFKEHAVWNVHAALSAAHDAGASAGDDYKRDERGRFAGK